jgi:ubiquinone/menaquinone biosynthesis C-methylase UbiE
MADASVDAGAFHDFERAAHDRIAESYRDLFTAVTDRAIVPLLDAARVGGGTRLLDVASGPGKLVAQAAARGARGIGVDLAPAMVALATRLHPGLDFRTASADELPFPTASFDAVTCSFGIGHFPEPERVTSEFARVLTTGGRVALSWWQGFAHNRINGVFHQALTGLGVTAPGAVPVGPSMDRYSDAARFSELVEAAGFDGVRVDDVSFMHRLGDVEELWNLAMGSFARASSVIRAQSTETQTRIRAAVVASAREYQSLHGLDIPVAFHVASGVRPR